MRKSRFMKIRFITILLSLIVIFSSQNAFAECVNNELQLSIENDSALTLGGGTDRFYSNGLEATYRCSRSVTNSNQKNPALRILKRLHPGQYYIEDNFVLRFGQKIFTNEELTIR